MPILADDLLVAGLARDHDDLGIGLRALVVGVDEDLAEAAREGLVARHVQLLVAEEDDAVVEQGLADVADGTLVEVRADVDIVDLGADGPGNGSHLDPAVAHHVSSGCLVAARLWRAPFLRNRIGRSHLLPLPMLLHRRSTSTCTASPACTVNLRWKTSPAFLALTV